MRTKRYDDALKHLQVGVELDPKEAQNYVGISRVYQAQGRRDEAIAVLSQAVGRAAYPTRPHEELAMLYKREGNEVESVKHFEAAAGIYRDILMQVPRQPEVLNDLASILIELKRYDEAAGILETAIQTAPSRAQPYISMGRIRDRQGNLDEAERLLRRALEIEPRNARAHERLGAVMGQREQWDQAKTHFQQALEIDPDFIQARLNLERLEAYLASAKEEATSSVTSQPATAPSNTSN